MVIPCYNFRVPVLLTCLEFRICFIFALKRADHVFSNIVVSWERATATGKSSEEAWVRQRRLASMPSYEKLFG